MSTVNAVRQVILKEAWIIPLVFKSSYWYVPFHPSFYYLLGFKIEDLWYQFTAMPFVLNITLRIFSMLCSVIIKELGIRA